MIGIRGGSVLLLIFNLVSEIAGCFCPHIWEPVCATDDQLYSNLCFFMCAKMNNQDLMPQHISVCTPPANPVNAGENEGAVEVPVAAPAPAPAAPQHTSNVIPDPTFEAGIRTQSAQAGVIFGQGYIPVCNWSCRKTPTYASVRICDEINGVYASDCEFYKSVCRAEYRGFLLRRVPCKKSQVTPNNRRKTWL